MRQMRGIAPGANPAPTHRSATLWAACSLPPAPSSSQTSRNRVPGFSRRTGNFFDFVG